ncbi:c-type cytochrome [Xanthobacter sp. AM11]|uniref:c-type cytochrome n=1 Tax=Xanthobacter sp. AM11 TaxID=3380643 RepID=UPI0039BEEBC9
MHFPPFVRRRSGLLALALLALSHGAAPAAAADARAGAALAQRWCAGCHVVGPEATRGTSDAPTFPAIAARGGDITAPWLAFRLLDPHPQMPSVSLSREQAGDLAAYFATLKK